MTINSATRKAGPFLGDGVTTVFPFTFKVFTKNDVQVTKTDANGAETNLVLDSEYSVTVNGDQTASPGGYITAVLPLATGYKLTLTGKLPNLQGTSLPDNGPWYPSVIEKSLDYSTILIQQLKEQVDRSIKIGVSDTPLTPLPGPQARANELIGFDAVGNLVIYPLTSSVGAGDRTSFALVAGVDFAPGATSLTLPKDPGTPGNLEVHFDAVPQDFTQWSVSGLTLTIPGGVPVGVTRVWGYIGTTLSTQIPPDNSVTDAKVALGVSASKISMKRAGQGAKQRTIADMLDDVVSVKDFGAIGDGNSHPLSDFYPSLAAAQIDYPAATSLTNQIDDIAINAAIVYAQSAKASVEIPYGIFLARQITVYTDTVIVGQGRNATVLKQVIGSNVDLIYGANSNANWGSGSPSNIVNGCTIVGLTLDGQWNNGAGNTAGSGIAVYGARPIWQDVFIKNVAEYGMRTEYNPTSSIGADAFTMEGELRNIRIDVCGKHGFWFNGPNDSVMDSVIVVDAGQAASNTWDAFYFDQYAIGRCYGLHAWNRQAAQRHRYGLQLRPGSQCEFIDCQFEGAYSGNVGIFSQRNIFSDSCRYFAAWNGINIYMGLNATLNQIRGTLDGAAAGRPAAVAGVVMGSTGGDFVADNLIDVMAIEQQAGVVIFNFSGGYNTIRARCYQTAGGTYSGAPLTTDDIQIRQHSATALDVDPKRYAAWVVFSVSGGGVVTVNASHNVTSVTRAAAGQYTITFANPLKVFAMMDGTCDYGQIVGKKVTPVRPGGNTTTTQDVHFRSDDGTYGDPNFASIGFVSGL